MSAPTYKPSIDSTAVDHGKAPATSDDEELHRYVTDDLPRAQKMTATRSGADNTQLIVSEQTSTRAEAEAGSC
jgi:hypothetical protein